MRRIYSDYAFGSGPRDTCWWDETIAAPDWPVHAGELQVDIAIVGGGFTGLSAALTLAEAGQSVALLEAGPPGWGASGRNGGFCCLGGSRLGDGEIRARYGDEGLRLHHAAERAAVDLVADRLQRYGIDADRHSDGETQLAHSPRAFDQMCRDAEQAARHHGVTPRIIAQSDLVGEGMNAGFFGAVTTPIGFALNPRKYLFGLARAAQAAGAQLFQGSAVTDIASTGRNVTLTTARGVIRCQQVILATNGYSSEDVPPWLAGRYLPTQSSIMVTRPLTRAELQAQGWTSHQASYDTRNLLHYFHLMPDGRFLFGTRGGLRATPGAQRRIRQANRRDFERMFPAWRAVETPHEWSGMVCLSRKKAPYIGPVPDLPGVHAALCYHGNGVAMGSWAGTQLALGLLSPQTAGDIPPSLRAAPGRFPLGRFRRFLMLPAYAAMRLADLR